MIKNEDYFDKLGLSSVSCILACIIIIGDNIFD